MNLIQQIALTVVPTLLQFVLFTLPTRKENKKLKNKLNKYSEIYIQKYLNNLDLKEKELLKHKESLESQLDYYENIDYAPHPEKVLNSFQIQEIEDNIELIKEEISQLKKEIENIPVEAMEFINKQIK